VNRALRRISLACLVMFVLLLINVNYLQGFQATSLASDKGNIRSFDQQYQYQRGSISTADGVTIAKSRPVKGVYKYQRYYPFGPVYAPVTGYDSLYSATGIEQAEDKLLSGTDPKLTVRNLIDLITGKPRQGASVRLTINSKAQQAAYTALKATEAGYEVGTRTSVDLLNARRNLVQAQTNFAVARYDYIVSVLTLRLAAGTLDRPELTSVNTWLTTSAPTSPAVETPATLAPTVPPADAPKP